MAENLNKRALLVSSDEGWEGLWIDRRLIKQYRTIQEGADRGLLFIAIAKKYNLTVDDFQGAHTNKEGEEHLYFKGSFPVQYDQLLPIIEFYEPSTLERLISFIE